MWEYTKGKEIKEGDDPDLALETSATQWGIGCHSSYCCTVCTKVLEVDSKED